MSANLAERSPHPPTQKHVTAACMYAYAARSFPASRPTRWCAGSEPSESVRLPFDGSRPPREKITTCVCSGRSLLASGGILFPPCLPAFSPSGGQSPTLFNPPAARRRTNALTLNAKTDASHCAGFPPTCARFVLPFGRARAHQRLSNPLRAPLRSARTHAKPASGQISNGRMSRTRLR